MSLPRLYAIVDDACAARVGQDPVALADAYMRGGARCLQLRAKDATSAAFLAWADGIAARAAEYGATLIVNDRADIAKLCGAGVHVGQDDLSAAAARRIVGEVVHVGLSTHTRGQLDRALDEPISYVAVGPVFGTLTKDTGYEAVGLDLVRAAVRRVDGQMPVVAIGGITLQTAASVIGAGASAVAVISDLTVGDPESRVRAFISALEAR
jgi:thiamine-phosphate pyrophosphorylase